MRFAYADPPYLGQCSKYDHRHDDGCWDDPATHARLVLRLADHDGWALSASSPSLPVVLPYCPPGVRIGAWVKPFASFKPGVTRAYAWEPVIFFGGRKRPRSLPTVRDWVACNITLKKGLTGAKPEAFCLWVFDFLGMLPTDTLMDLFPGTGAVTRAFERWKEFWPDPPSQALK